MATIIYINAWFLIIGLLSIILTALFGFIQFNFKTKVLKTTIANQNINNNITRDYIHYLKTQNNFICKQKLSKNLKTNYFEYLKIYAQKTKFDSQFDFFQSLLMNLVYMILVLLASYLIVEKSFINLGQLTLLISLSAMLNSSIGGICDFIIKRIEYRQMVEIYQNFINLANIKDTGTIKIDNIRSLQYHDKKINWSIKNGSRIHKHKNVLLDALTKNNNEPDIQLLINGIDVNDINYDNLASKTYIINYDTQIDCG
jgi:ABC-type bacteriocin/lantibiotic exporter with double-glycine peptidase domain